MQFLFIPHLAIADKRGDPTNGRKQQQGEQTSRRQNLREKRSVRHRRRSVPIETKAVRTTSNRSSPRTKLDRTLEQLLVKNDVQPIEIPIQNHEHVALGQKLIFDRILSGNYDTACATIRLPIRPMISLSG